LPTDAAVFTADGGIRTGDLGRLDADGYLHITGRVREVYKLENGKFVTPAPMEEQITMSPYIAQAMVHGLNRPHNVALVVVDVAAVRGWSQQKGHAAAGDATALLAEPRVRTLIAEEIERRTSDFKGYERVRDFVLVAEPFSLDNDLLTPTLKVKRRNVMARYGEVLEGLYRR
jgi:long-chain acyl-CoA synthetase